MCLTVVSLQSFSASGTSAVLADRIKWLSGTFPSLRGFKCFFWIQENYLLYPFFF